MSNRGSILLLAVSLATLSAAGCTTESYCFDDCQGEGSGTGGLGGAGGGTAGTGGASGSGGQIIPTGGQGGGDGGTAGTGPCVETNGGIEACDDLDNDCNGQVDETFNLAKDIHNCGICLNDCTRLVSNALQATCTATAGTKGTCGYTECATDFWDRNGDTSDGCEYYCIKKSSSDLTCDNVDDDCNGDFDDGVDLCSDATNCGRCGRNCQGQANARGMCVKDANATDCDEGNTHCQIASCEPGWFDANKKFADGCEYECTPTKRTDPNDPDTLTECDPATDPDCGKREYCDQVDNDCDGSLDGIDPDILDPNKGDPGVNQPCFGSEEGECVTAPHAGITRCQAAQIRCVNNNSGVQSCNSDSDCASNPVNKYCVESPTPPAKVCGTKVLRVNDVPELCDGKDNDCDGTEDDNPTDVGAFCGSSVGLCMPGKYACQAGTLQCVGAVGAQPETCNGADDDCDGVTDGTTTAVPQSCTTDANCASLPTAKFCLTVSGTTNKVCAAPPTDVVDAQNNPIACWSASSPTPPVPPQGWDTPCRSGTLACVGGSRVCTNAVYASTNQDTCGHDMNCDGQQTPLFLLGSDPRNCGSCGNDCSALGGHVNWTCTAGQCVANGCVPGWIDCNGSPDTCERACDFVSNQELCNGYDDNCDCRVDETYNATTAPNGVHVPSPLQVCGITTQTGPCATETTVACSGNPSSPWSCTFPSAAYCSQGGCASTPDICDEIDNNCNGNIDENYKPPILNQGYLGQTCKSDDGLPATQKHGVCQQSGTFKCATTTTTSCQSAGSAPIAGVKLDCATLPGGCEELCDGKDNDCDGSIDEPVRAKGSNTDYWVKPAVVRVGTGPWMFTYEASRPGATTTSAGTGNGWHRSSSPLTAQPTPPSGTTLDKTPACSAQGRVPWFNISGPEAQHVCREMGGRLCTNTEWRSACSVSSCNWSFTPTATCNNFTSLCTGNACVCNLGPYDFSTTVSGNQDGLLPTAWGGAPPPAIQSTCRTVHSGGSLYDLTGNLRELTCPDVNKVSTPCTATTDGFVLMGGAFNTSDPTGEGAKCNFTFYNVDARFKLFDVGFRCCFDSNPS